MALYSLNTCIPYAHARVEVLDAFGAPRIEMLLKDGSVWATWREFVRMHSLRIASQRSYARSIGLFLDFLASHGMAYQAEDSRHELFLKFARSLMEGTIEGGEDHSGLWWWPRSANTTYRCIKEVTCFSDWLADSGDIKPLNPSRNATVAEQIMFWRGWRLKNEASLLAHLGPNSETYRAARITRVANSFARGKVASWINKAFPEENFSALLSTGFRRSHERRWSELRDKLITILMHGGGIRLSEALHIWCCDVTTDPVHRDSAFVRVYHPSDGLITYQDHSGGSQQILRSQFLMRVYGRKPLTHESKNRQVGWKNPLLEDSTQSCFNVYWRDPSYGRLFFRLYEEYIRRRPRPLQHPYLFEASTGRPFTIRGFEKVHAAAMRRIGLLPAKDYGTTPYGHRHAYGQWMRRAGLDSKVIQRVMHHRSVASQQPYTEPSPHKIQTAINAALSGFEAIENVCVPS